jgi:hypothetical protein
MPYAKSWLLVARSCSETKRDVRGVFDRLKLYPREAKVEQVVYKAKALHPKFPGIIDLPCWAIGRNWCKKKQPEVQLLLHE